MKGRWKLFALLVLVLSALAATAFAGDPDAGQGVTGERRADNGELVERCGTVERGRSQGAPGEDQIRRWISENRIAAGGVIPVNFHVIYTASEGNVPESQLDAQITVLNNNYAGKNYGGSTVPGAANTGYTFVKASVTRTRNNKWFRMTPGSGAESQAKNALVTNPTGSLNFYTCKPGQNLLGWATFPWNLAGNPNMDGVVIHYGSLPGGYLSPYNLGGTGSHEVGHWVGLYHTFQGGCGTDCATTGDLVCDTPAQASPTSGCPIGRDSCPASGLDPIHNYMDYSTDVCYDNFTSGQDARADFMMATYRPVIGSGRLAELTPPAGPGSGADNGRRADNGELVERCGTVEHGRSQGAPDEDQIRQWISENRIAAGGVIPVNVHVIYSNSEGNVSDAQIDAQIAVMNNNFAGKDYNGNPVSGACNTGYTFVKASTTRTLASGGTKSWFTMTPGSRGERNAKNSLAVNWTSTLNLYTCKPGQNLLGWATFPWNLSTNGKQDGVVIHYGSLPGGYLSPYNLGGTATHEVGHWVGLYHTFQGGCGTSDCANTGDLVCDTPAEGTATSGCPSGKDSCPSLAGLDPIHNYMDYSTDICYTQFTCGQDARADFMMNTYRPLIGAGRLAQGAGAMQSARGGELADFGLRAAPNPFNPRTKIEFALSREGRVSVRVFDVHGHQVSTVVDRVLAAGPHRFDFDGDRLGSGIYVIQFRAEGREVVRRMTLLK